VCQFLPLGQKLRPISIMQAHRSSRKTPLVRSSSPLRFDPPFLNCLGGTLLHLVFFSFPDFFHSLPFTRLLPPFFFPGRHGLPFVKGHRFYSISLSNLDPLFPFSVPAVAQRRIAAKRVIDLARRAEIFPSDRPVLMNLFE